VGRLVLKWFLLVTVPIVLFAVALGILVSSSRVTGRGNPTAGPANLNSTLLRATTYYSGHHDSYAGLDGAFFRQTESGASVLPGSSSSTQQNIVSMAVGPTTLVMTVFRPGGNECLGILSVRRPLARPYFPAYPVTAKVGTYHFIASSGSSCAAASAVPAPVTKSQPGLTTQGFGVLLGGG
jgi:hypothetical protein